VSAAAHRDVVYEDVVTIALSRYLREDPKGLAILMDAIDTLADDPHPPGTARFGPTVCRWHVDGRWRVMYDVTATEVRIGQVVLIL